MRGAGSPEELELLLEDAFVVEDPAALVRLFEHEALLGTTVGDARGGTQIGRLAVTAWRRGCRYVGEPQRVLQTRDTALVLSRDGTNVARRRRDGEWRYLIAHLREGGGR